MLRLLLLSLFFFFPLTGTDTLFLRDRFAQSEAGDYLVAYINKAYTLLHIHTHTNRELTVEEITVPCHLLEESTDWRKWVADGAPGHTGWVMYQIAPQTGEILEFYSFTHRAWTQVSDVNNFISNLLRLEFLSVREEDRKRVGPAPLPGSLDRRRIWNPPANFEGSRIENTHFSCWRTTWPADGSELAGKTIEAYLPESGPYPNYFPYWIEVRGNIVRASVRVKDTGKGMVSPIKGMPQRPLSLHSKKATTPSYQQ